MDLSINQQGQNGMNIFSFIRVHYKNAHKRKKRDTEKTCIVFLSSSKTTRGGLREWEMLWEHELTPKCRCYM